MYDDFKELLSALNARRVKYLVVGGWAVSRHAQPRATMDLDILIQPAPRNGAALFRALLQFGAPLGGLKPADFIARGSFFRMGRPPIAIDILPEISGVAFDEAWRNRVTLRVDRSGGLRAHFISAADLITAKLAAGRPQDLADVDAIRQAQAGKLARAARRKGKAMRRWKP